MLGWLHYHPLYDRGIHRFLDRDDCIIHHSQQLQNLRQIMVEGNPRYRGLLTEHERDRIPRQKRFPFHRGHGVALAKSCDLVQHRRAVRAYRLFRTQ